MFTTLQFLAQAAQPGTVPDPKAQMIQTLGMFAIMGVMFYFALIRPQRQRAKQLEATIKSLKPGDRILTNAGILGTVVTIREKSISIRSDDAKIEIAKTSISEVTERKGETAVADAKS